MDAAITTDIGAGFNLAAEGLKVYQDLLDKYNDPAVVKQVVAAMVKSWQDKDAADLAALNADPANAAKLTAVEKDAS